MVDGDDGQLGTITLDRDVNCGLVKGSVDIVDGNRVVRVGAVEY